MHTITKSIVRIDQVSLLRARCSCLGFTSDVPRLSTAGRRKQDRLISEHLTSTTGVADTAALLGAVSIEAML